MLRKTLAGLVLLAGLAGAEPKMPAPQALFDERAVSLCVVHGRAEDAGFRELLKTAWDSLRQRGPGGSGGFLDLITTFLTSTTQENLLLEVLPFQAVRVDQFDRKGSIEQSFMVTVTGWPGVQGLFWNTLLSAPDGKAYPTDKVGVDTIVMRPKTGQPVENATTVSRIAGTFYSFPDPETARRILGKKPPKKPHAQMLQILGEVDQNQDTYGIIINRQGSLWRFLNWINQRDLRTVIQAVGEERLRNALSHVDHLTWQGDLISDDRVEMQVRFRTDGPAQAEELQQVISGARQALAEKGRTGNLQMTTVDQDVLVDIQFVGYRQMLVDYLQRK